MARRRPRTKPIIIKRIVKKPTFPLSHKIFWLAVCSSVLLFAINFLFGFQLTSLVNVFSITYIVLLFFWSLAVNFDE